LNVSVSETVTVPALVAELSEVIVMVPISVTVPVVVVPVWVSEVVPLDTEEVVE
jgi:hypothetical protein